MSTIKMAPIGAPGTKIAIDSLLRKRGPVVSWNSALYQRNAAALEGGTEDQRGTQIQALKAVFEQFSAGRNAVMPDQAPVPTRVRQQLVQRIHCRAMSQMFWLDYCDARETLPGEELMYRTQGVSLPSVYRISHAGGNWVEVHRHEDTLVSLGKPSIYTTPEIWIPRFDPRFPDRYLEDIAAVGDAAGIALAEQFEGDAETAVGNQFCASGLRAAMYDWISSRVQSANLPDANILEADILTGNVDMGTYQALALHAMTVEGTFARFDMAPSTIATMWNAVTAGADFADLPEAFRGAVLSGGEDPYMQMFGMRFPLPRPNNTIDASGSDKYFYGLLEPSDPMRPRGAVWFYAWPDATSLGPNGAAYVVDNLQFLRSQATSTAVYDIFVLQKNALFAGTSYQKANLVKVQYAPAAG